MKRIERGGGHEKYALVNAAASNSEILREHTCREKTALTLASMLVVMAKPLGRPENVLQMVVNERWHAPVQSAALCFASTKQRRWTELSFTMTKQFAAVSAVALCN